MEQKSNRIAAFIEKLPMDASTGDCESTLLSTNMEFIGGGGDNNNACINDYYDRCNKSNNGGDCQNYNTACTKSTNRGSCINTSGKRPGSSVILPTEPGHGAFL